MGSEDSPLGRWQFTAHAANVPQVRAVIARSAFDAGARDGALENLMLIASELATNAVVHARTPFVASLAWGESSLEIAVEDRDPRPPVTRVAGAGSEHGRGLELLTDLAQEYGWEPIKSEGQIRGKRVWARVGL